MKQRLVKLTTPPSTFIQNWGKDATEQMELMAAKFPDDTHE